MSEEAVRVIIRKKQEIVFEGVALRVTSINEKGEFDIYPFHANFVSVILNRLELEKLDKKILRFGIEKGILWAKENKVEVYVGI